MWGLRELESSTLSLEEVIQWPPVQPLSLIINSFLITKSGPSQLSRSVLNPQLSIPLSITFNNLNISITND